MSDSSVKKADFSAEFQSVLPQAQYVAGGGNVEAGCEILLNLEKQARLGNDISTLKSVVASILELCAHYKRWELLKDHILILSKRRGQKYAAITVIIQKSMDFLPSTPSESVKMDIIGALLTVSEGKIYLEKERATLTQMLSQIKEARGEMQEAASILQQVHVETFGAMTKLEKTEYILEQVRLTLSIEDYVRANIVAKKILRRTLEEDGMEECKLKYYHLLIKYDTHEKNTLELCRHYMAIYGTKKVQNDSKLWKDALEQAVLFVLLSPYSNHQHDLLHRLALEKQLQQLPAFASLVKQFTTNEIIAYPMKELAVLKSHDVFTQDSIGNEWLIMLQERVIEHNIRVIGKHYERVRVTHLAKLIGLSEEKTEESVSHLVSNGSIFAKIDRPAQIISFRPTLLPEERLSLWSADISQLLALVETTCHLINKENMIHKF